MPSFNVRSLRGVLGCACLVFGCNQAAGIDEVGDKPPLRPGECRTHTDCIDASSEYAPDVCVNDRCVPLLTDECPLALPQTGNGWLAALRKTGPQALIVGAYSWMGAHPFDDALHNYDLALTELANTTGGVPVGGETRPVIALACQRTSATPEGLDASAHHLIDELEVPVLLNGLFTEDSQYIFEQFGHDRHVFFLSPFEGSEDKGATPDDGLIWSILPPITDLAPAYGALVQRARRHLIDTGVLQPDEPPRIAMLRANDVRELNNLASAITDSLDLTAEDGPSAQFASFNVESSQNRSPPPDYSDTIVALKAFEPQIVIGVTTNELASTIMPALEDSDLETKPFYVLSYPQYQSNELPQQFDRFPDLYSRIAGVNFSAAVDPAPYDRYAARFRSAFTDPTLSVHAENTYDAMYYLLYSLVAARKELPMTGSDLVTGMRHLLTGRVNVEVGPADLPEGFKALAAADSSIT